MGITHIKSDERQDHIFLTLLLYLRKTPLPVPSLIRCWSFRTSAYLFGYLLCNNEQVSRYQSLTQEWAKINVYEEVSSTTFSTLTYNYKILIKFENLKPFVNCLIIFVINFYNNALIESICSSWVVKSWN